MHRWAIAAIAACLAVPAAASGHAEEMTFDELAETMLAASASSTPPAMTLQPDAEPGEALPPKAAAPRSWYLRQPSAARLGSSDDSRYTLAGGCFALRPMASDDGAYLARSGPEYEADAPSGEAEVFRFQPTGLGSYLLLGGKGRLPARMGDTIGASNGPVQRAEWIVDGDSASGYQLTSRNGEMLDAAPSGELTTSDSGDRFALRAAPGCASFPEIEVNAFGSPYTASPRFGEARGTIDLHSHLMAFEGFGRGLHCGRPWHPLGVEAALVDCPDHAPNGLGGVVSNLLVFQDPAKTHHPDGWPTFQGWPTKDWNFTHEQTYYRWIERAWRGGMRLITLLAVDNSAACMVNVHRTKSCNEMQAVRRQLRAAKDLQRYIDAQWGGPGKGFFRIVRNPFQARRAINNGKLAIVLGVEVSEPLDCGIRNGVPQCDKGDVTAGLDELFEKGVRQMELVNKFDNAFSGVAMDGGFQGPVINSANKLVTGEFWDVETCTGPDADRTQITSVPDAAAQLIAMLPGGSLQLPAYPPPPHCNTRGLTELGRHAIRQMAKRKMIFDPDHMSVLARRHALDLIDSLDYSGVVSSHSWADRTSYRRIMELGGVVTPMASDADEFDEHWASQRRLYRQGDGSRRYGFGFGFADDMNGFGGPREATGGTDAEISYPFTSPIDRGVRLRRQQSGTRTYDLNADGMAHFGQWPDWTEGVHQDGGHRVTRDLRNGAEYYLRMWERAVGIPGPHRKRRHGHIGARGIAGMKLGMSPNRLLKRSGQPVKRTRGWLWEVRRSPGARLGAAFAGGSKVALIATTARGYRAARIRPGMRAGRLAGTAEPLGRGIWTRNAGNGTRYVFGVRDGRVHYVGVGTAKETRSARRAARAVRLALRGR